MIGLNYDDKTRDYDFERYKITWICGTVEFTSDNQTSKNQHSGKLQILKVLNLQSSEIL